MTEPLHVLQGGHLRRRGHTHRPGSPGRHRQRHEPSSHRRARLLVLTLAIALVVLLAALVQVAAGPPLARTITPAAHTVPPVRSDYGLVPAPPSQQVSVRLKLPLRSGLLFNVRTGQVLWSLHPDRVAPIASLTKMMTALLVVEHSQPTDRVLATYAAVHFSGSGIGLLPVGKRVPELALLYGLLLPSGNDAAIALAQHVAGTQPRFIAMMNARAQLLGLRCTHFTSVSGVIDQGNHSCAPDLALLAHLMLEQPLLARIVGSRSAVVRFPIKGGRLFLYNNNPLLVLGYPGTDGVKTGYTTVAGPCLVATARRGRTWLGVVLLDSGNTAYQAQSLLNAGFARLRGA